MTTRRQTAERIVRDLELMSPYRYEALYAAFLGTFMEPDRSEWTSQLSNYLNHTNQDWAYLSSEIAAILWDRFEKRISC